MSPRISFEVVNIMTVISAGHASLLNTAVQKAPKGILERSAAWPIARVICESGSPSFAANKIAPCRTDVARCLGGL
jgi:hypothetical protein